MKRGSFRAMAIAALAFAVSVPASRARRASMSDSENDDGGATATTPPPTTTACYAPNIVLPPDIDPPSHGSKVVIAHRGASASLPEHSLEGYRLALELGADYVEPDLVTTKDGHLIAIHSMDLNITTDVAVKFGGRETFSPYMNRTGFWSYDFTLEEVSALRIKQRLPDARTGRYDGIFQIPTLTSILELIHEWNAVVEMKRVNPAHERAVRGVYAELKDYPWLLKDTGHDLVDLLFDHIDSNEELWEKSILSHACDTKRLREHGYRLPPLVIQCFEGDALKYFVETWDAKVNKINLKNDSRSELLPAPPTILLVDHDECLEDSFWFRVEERYRKILSGLGPDKSCLFDKRWREFMERATKSELAVHPWTARPELQFLPATTGVDDLPFQSVLDEIRHLFCVVGVHGIFSESVDVAVLAATLPCPTTDRGKSKESICDDVCYQNTAKAQALVGLSSFAMGIVIAVSVNFVIDARRLRGGRQERVPTEEEKDEIVDGAGGGTSFDDSDELTSEEREML